MCFRNSSYIFFGTERQKSPRKACRPISSELLLGLRTNLVVGAFLFPAQRSWRRAVLASPWMSVPRDVRLSAFSFPEQISGTIGFSSYRPTHASLRGCRLDVLFGVMPSDLLLDLHLLAKPNFFKYC